MSAYQYIYVMKNLSKSYSGGKKVISDLTLSFLPGAKIGVLGPNGAGKSTLLKIMAGVDKEFTGEAWSAEGTKIGYLPQEPQLDSSKTVLQNVLDGLGPLLKKIARFNEIGAEMGNPDADMDALLAEMGDLQADIDSANGWDAEREAKMLMQILQCPPADSSVEKLSGGEKRRVALARLLIEKPDMLLLDEPTNHLDASSVGWLQEHLLDYKGTVVMITHDRYFLDNVTGWILEMDRGTGIPYEGNYSMYLEKKSKRLSQEAREEERRQRVLDKELEWMRQSPKARQAKSKARINNYHDLLKASQDQTQRNAQIVISPPPRLGDLVIEAKNVSKSFGDRTLFKDVSFKIPAGGIVGIIGPNGAGKTTLFRMITGQEKPDSGEIIIGDTVELGYIDQSRDSLNDKATVWEEISNGDDVIYLGKMELQSRAYTSSFNFRGPDQQKRVGVLSGGERNRVHLAKMLRKTSNVLLLDEPTNDLDTETLSALEEALETFPGCAVVISHDRMFLDRVATHILAYEPDGVVWFEGNYAEYEADYNRRHQVAA